MTDDLNIKLLFTFVAFFIIEFLKDLRLLTRLELKLVWMIQVLSEFTPSADHSLSWRLFNTEKNLFDPVDDGVETGGDLKRCLSITPDGGRTSAAQRGPGPVQEEH